MARKLSIKRILQALYYIQSHAPVDNGSRLSKVYLLKILFFADRYHLRNFGVLATGDTYFAMKMGPVASVTFDILKGKFPTVMNAWEYPLISEVEDIDENNVNIKAQDDDELSESFKEALDFSLSTFGSYQYDELSDISHDYPEWKRFKEDLEHLTAKRFEMSEDDFFENPKTLEKSKKYKIVKDPYDEDEEFLAVMREKLD